MNAILMVTWQYKIWFGSLSDMWTVSGEDGSFLVRPSQSQNPLTLTLWYRRRPYNISIRQRSDGRCALGTEKENEQVCSSVLVISLHKSLALHFTKPEGLLLWLLGWAIWYTCLPIYVCYVGKSNEFPISEKKKLKWKRPYCVQLQPQQSAYTVCDRCGNAEVWTK
jgi:hypothetical protein